MDRGTCPDQFLDYILGLPTAREYQDFDCVSGIGESAGEITRDAADTASIERMNNDRQGLSFRLDRRDHACTDNRFASTSSIHGWCVLRCGATEACVP